MDQQINHTFFPLQNGGGRQKFCDSIERMIVESSNKRSENETETSELCE